MRKVILDTSFILSCIRNKLDFFQEIYLMGVGILIPDEVIREIRGLSEKKSEAGLALKILEKNNYEKISLGSGNVDKKIINYARKNSDLIVATLDREIKNKISNKKLVIRGKKKLEVI